MKSEQHYFYERRTQSLKLGYVLPIAFRNAVHLHLYIRADAGTMIAVLIQIHKFKNFKTS